MIKYTFKTMDVMDWLLVNYKKAVILITFKKAFLSSIFLLIFSLLRTGFLAWHNKFEKRKALIKKLNKELMHVAWDPNRWWDWCVSKGDKK